MSLNSRLLVIGITLLGLPLIVTGILSLHNTQQNTQSSPTTLGSNTSPLSLDCSMCGLQNKDGICYNVVNKSSYCIRSSDHPDIGFNTLCRRCPPITPNPSVTCTPMPPQCMPGSPLGANCPNPPQGGWCPITTPFPSVTPPPGCFYQPNKYCTIACPVNNPYCCPPILVCPTITPEPTCIFIHPTCIPGQECPQYIICAHPTPTPTPSIAVTPVPAPCGGQGTQVGSFNPYTNSTTNCLTPVPGQ